MIFKRRKLDLGFVRTKRHEQENEELRHLNCYEYKNEGANVRHKIWVQRKRAREESRRANRCTIELKVTPDMKIYDVLNKTIYNSNYFCDDTKRYCYNKSIVYVGQLVQKLGCEMSADYETLINLELNKFGLSLNTHLIGWKFPITATQKRNLNLPIDLIKIDSRIVKAIVALQKEYKLETLKDLIQMTCIPLLRFPNFGRTSLKKIEKILHEYDLYFGMDLDGDNK